MTRSDPALAPTLRAAAPWIAAVLVLTVLGITRGGAAPVGVFYDDAIYVDLARSIAGGHGYRHLALPGAPVGVHYPPLYPMWLAAWSVLLPPVRGWSAVAWLKLGNALLAAASVIVWARWGARRLGVRVEVAAICAAASVLLVPARAVTSTLYSEPLAWLLLGGALLAVDGALAPAAEDPRPDGDESAASPAGHRRAVTACALAGLLPMVRVILLPFALATAWAAARHTRFGAGRRAALVVLALAPTAGWMLWTARHGSGIPDAWRSNYGTYTGMWLASLHGIGDLVRLAAGQASAIWRTARVMWSAPGAVVALVACAAGLFVALRGSRIAVLGTLGYLAIVLAWPVTPSRFLWGVLPLITLLGAAGVAWAWRAAPRRAVAWGAVALSLLPVGACTRITVHGYRNDGWLVPQWKVAKRYAPLVRWARTLPPNAVVVTEDDPLLAAATGRHTAPLIPPELVALVDSSRARSDRDRVARSACAAGAGWIAVPDAGDIAWRAVRALVEAPPAGLRFGSPVQVGPIGAAIPFACAGGERAAERAPEPAPEPLETPSAPEAAPVLDGADAAAAAPASRAPHRSPREASRS
ncbi:MAG TPA: hypothetical protein VFS44_07340 [Gemmatimonadaceae bacterium]|nr:hypothetical protein [Gemmatimonadaceae bacterium]